jgi:hypothetical protein
MPLQIGNGNHERATKIRFDTTTVAQSNFGLSETPPSPSQNQSMKPTNKIWSENEQRILVSRNKQYIIAMKNFSNRKF